MPGRHKGGCKPGCEGCGLSCWCHGAAAEKPSRKKIEHEDPGLKAAVVRLRTALDAAKAFIATVKRDIELTAAELEAMIGGQPPED